MKKLIVVILVCVFMCVPQGCTSKQLNERMVIQGIGIDYADDNYTVTVMYMNTDSTNQSEPCKKLTGKGRTITEAVTAIVSKNGLEPLYSHNSFILLGESLCRYGVSEALEFFAGYYQCRPSVNVLVGGEEASELMSVKDITPQSIEELAESKNTTGRALTMPMYKFVADIINETSSACTGLLTLDEDDLKYSGVAVFDGDKISYKLNGSLTMGVMLLRGESDISAEVIPLGGENKSFALKYDDSEINVGIKDNRLYCDVTIKGEATIYEYTRADEEAKKKIESKITSLIEDAIKACTENKSDIFNMGKILRQSDYEAYMSIEDWGELVKNGVYNVISDISVK